MIRILVLFALIIVCSHWGHSQMVTAPTLYSTEDAQTSSNLPSNNYGSTGTMGVSKTYLSVFRSFVKFDLSSIPSDAVITSAILKLTPNGTENVAAVNSTELYLDMCNTDWAEATLTHSSGISNNTFYPTVTTSNSVSGKREFDVKNFVQAFVDGRLPNSGWRIRRSDETTNANTTYFTREDATASNRPQLVIQYYLRSYVSAAVIVHTSTLSSTDGSISPTVTNGSNTTKTFRWYNASGTQVGTSQNLTGVGKGWYGLKYYGSAAGDTTYQAFIIGTECEETSVTFDPGPNYIDDAPINSLVRGSGTTSIFHTYYNSGANPNFGTERWTNSNVWYNQKAMMRFKLWVDPSIQVDNALLTLTGNAHSPLNRSNESELQRITGSWTESGVTNYNAPASTSTNKILVAAIPAGNNNLTTDLAGFYNIWKTNNLDNHGVLLQLQSFSGDLYTRMQFHSSDATTAANRPKIVFTIKVNTCDLSRKGTVTLTSNDPALKQNIQVAITPPSWAVSPYNYVISDLAIPAPKDMLRYLNDSVMDPDLDSTKFYLGTVNSSSFDFGNVDYGHYNIAVFDNTGKRIFEQTSIDTYPAITLLANTNTTIINNNMIRPTGAGTSMCEINAFVNTSSQGGSVKIRPTVITGTQYYGFMDISRTLASSADIRYGYYLNGNRLYTIKNYVVSGSYITVTATNYAIMSIVNDSIIFSNDTMVIDKAALPVGYSLKLGGVMNANSRTFIKLRKIPFRTFYLQELSGTERSCTAPTANFQFRIMPFFGSGFGSYTYQLTATNANIPVPSYSGTGLNNGTVTISNPPPGVYTLTCTQSSGGSPITLNYTVYIGVQADWFSTRPNYNLSPNSYSLSRNNVQPIAVYSSAISTNFLPAGTKGWVWFSPVVSAFLQTRNDYLSIVDNFTNTQPSSSQTYLSFRKVLPAMTGGIPIPGGTQIIWRDQATTAIGSAIVSDNAFITIEMTGTTMNVKANGLLVVSLTQPTGGIRLKANSNRTNEGFKNVHMTFTCTPNQTIDQVGYYELARDYTAGYATAVEGKLKFTFDEEYAIEAGKNLQYVVYNDTHTAIASSTMTGVVTGGATALPYSFEDNRYILTVSSISTAAVGKFYHLEVTTSTGQKRVLRFLYKN